MSFEPTQFSLDPRNIQRTSSTDQSLDPSQKPSTSPNNDVQESVSNPASSTTNQLGHSNPTARSGTAEAATPTQNLNQDQGVAMPSPQSDAAWGQAGASKIGSSASELGYQITNTKEGTFTTQQKEQIQSVLGREIAKHIPASFSGDKDAYIKSRTQEIMSNLMMGKDDQIGGTIGFTQDGYIGIGGEGSFLDINGDGKNDGARQYFKIDESASDKPLAPVMGDEPEASSSRQKIAPLANSNNISGETVKNPSATTNASSSTEVAPQARSRGLFTSSPTATEANNPGSTSNRGISNATSLPLKQSQELSDEIINAFDGSTIKVGTEVINPNSMPTESSEYIKKLEDGSFQICGDNTCNRPVSWADLSKWQKSAFIRATIVTK